MVARRVTLELAVVLLEPLVLAVDDLVPGSVVVNDPAVAVSVVPLHTVVLVGAVLLDCVEFEPYCSTLRCSPRTRPRCCSLSSWSSPKRWPWTSPCAW
eukprot:563867-Pyramimonas_sp.AAC.1